ncbi:MAG: hypothetical protein ACHBN1_10245 [Heteroscytonema crispum UTEX LB 1556]
MQTPVDVRSRTNRSLEDSPRSQAIGNLGQWQSLKSVGSKCQTKLPTQFFRLFARLFAL